MRFIDITIAAALLACGGCRSVTVINRGQEAIKGADGLPVLVNGAPVVISRGWEVKHFQHWMITRADSVKAGIKPDDITFELNGLDEKPDGEGLALVVEKALTGAADLAAKIGAAIATSGGSVGVEAITATVRKFIARGGDVSKASVSVSDGVLTCTDGTCTECIECAYKE